MDRATEKRAKSAGKAEALIVIGPGIRVFSVNHVSCQGLSVSVHNCSLVTGRSHISVQDWGNI
jgi:hypothetical protein